MNQRTQKPLPTDSTLILVAAELTVNHVPIV